MHSLCSGHSAPVISGVSVVSNPPRRKINGNQGSSPLAALSPPGRTQRCPRPMATCADCAHAFDRSSDGHCALAASADAWRGVIPAYAQASPLVQSAYHRRTMTSSKPFVWRCHTCGCEVEKPLQGPTGQPGVYWPYCADCFAKLSDKDQQAVSNEKVKPHAY
jgi:hypothetical protein